MHNSAVHSREKMKPRSKPRNDRGDSLQRKEHQTQSSSSSWSRPFLGRRQNGQATPLPSLAKVVQPPNAAQTRDALVREINTFAESLRVAGRLSTVGVKGDITRALLLPAYELETICRDVFQELQHDDPDVLPSSQHFCDLVSKALSDKVGTDDIAVLQKLLGDWRKAAMSSFRSAAGGDARRSENESRKNHQDVPFPLEALRQGYEVEGVPALQRGCMHHFLDWVQHRSQRLSALTAQSDRGSSGPSVLFPIHHFASVLLSHLTHLLNLTDYSLPANRYPIARTMNRQIHLHIGPTNSGKTYGALLALTKAEKGMYAGPLRLLAHEVFERINEGTIGNVPPRPCNLVTGEEMRIVDQTAGLISCTVEMTNFERVVDVAVVDEIQMIGEPSRGSAWTSAVLGLPAKELHLCGEASVLPLIRRLVALCNDELHVHTYQRLTPLRVADRSLGGDLSKIEKGDCIVTFARSNIFFLKRMIEQKTGLRCAVAYGALPPETRSEQAKLFNDTSENGLDVMVASDAIGMGLNLKIKRVIFETCSKWDGTEQVALSTSQIKQIAGRAGRYGTQDTSDGSEAPGGVVTTLHEDDLPFLHAALASGIVPIRRAGLTIQSDALLEAGTLIASTDQVDRSLGMDIWSDADPSVQEEADEEASGKKKKGRASVDDEDLENGDAEEDEDGKSRSRRSRRSRREEEEKRQSREQQEEEKPQSLQSQKMGAILKVLQPEGLSDPKKRPPWFDSSRSLSTLYSFISQLVRFDPTLFFLPDYAREHGVSPILEASSRGQITLSEKELISKAPANLRDERVVVLMSSIIRAYGRGELVRFQDCAHGLGMMEVLDQVEKAVKELRPDSASPGPASDGEGASLASATTVEDDADANEVAKAIAEQLQSSSRFKRASLDISPDLLQAIAAIDGVHPVLNLQSLLVLESLHRALTMYMWLSYRFVIAFAYSQEALALKLRTERAIEYVLAATRFKPVPRKTKPTQRAVMAEEGEEDGDVWSAAGADKGFGEEVGFRGATGAGEQELMKQWASLVKKTRTQGQAKRATAADKIDVAAGDEVKVVLGEGAGGVIKDAA
ncbi:RNA helicase [Tilletia horrida]|nr:RNA helicase [Tilletia horrida]